VVDICHGGEDGLYNALTTGSAAIILDIMLLQLDGWTVLTELRRAGRDTPVLILTARDAVPDRIRGLDLGADDYLVKPFAFSELLARVRTLLRRTPVRRPEVLSVADPAIDVRRDRVTRVGQTIELTPKEFLLLSLLAEREGEVLSRMLIAERVWDMNVVDVHITISRGLRPNGDDPFERKLIHAVRGLGYVLR
jgi:two-component system copper resistance phosphate regulon response regulator CusR